MNLKNIKEFLKPDWRKLVVEVVLILILLVTLFTSVKKFAIVINIVRTILMLPWYLGLIWSSLTYLYIFIIVVEPIYLYLLSCLIFWIYDKVKKK